VRDDLHSQRRHRPQAQAGGPCQCTTADGDGAPPVQRQRHREAQRQRGGNQQWQGRRAGSLRDAHGPGGSVTPPDFGDAGAEFGRDLAGHLRGNALDRRHEHLARLLELHDDVAVTLQQRLVRGNGASSQQPRELVRFKHRLHGREHQRPRSHEVRRAAFKHLHRDLLGDRLPHLPRLERPHRPVGEWLRFRELQIDIAGGQARKRQRRAEHDQAHAASADHPADVGMAEVLNLLRSEPGIVPVGRWPRQLKPSRDRPVKPLRRAGRGRPRQAGGRSHSG
jgi:hypothetical protein